MNNPRNPGPQHVDHGDAMTGGKPEQSDASETQEIDGDDVGNVGDILGERRKQQEKDPSAS